MSPLAWAAIMILLGAMRDNGRHMMQISLANTNLSDAQGMDIANALTSLPARVATGAEVMDLSRISLPPAVRAAILAAAVRAEVDVRLSLPNGAALRVRN